MGFPHSVRQSNDAQGRRRRPVAVATRANRPSAVPLRHCPHEPRVITLPTPSPRRHGRSPTSDRPSGRAETEIRCRAEWVGLSASFLNSSRHRDPTPLLSRLDPSALLFSNPAPRASFPRACHCRRDLHRGAPPPTPQLSRTATQSHSLEHCEALEPSIPRRHYCFRGRSESSPSERRWTAAGRRDPHRPVSYRP